MTQRSRFQTATFWGLNAFNVRSKGSATDEEGTGPRASTHSSALGDGTWRHLLIKLPWGNSRHENDLKNEADQDVPSN